MSMRVGTGSAILVAALVVAGCGGPEGEDSTEGGGRASYCYSCDYSSSMPKPLVFPVTYERTTYAATDSCYAKGLATCTYFTQWVIALNSVSCVAPNRDAASGYGFQQPGSHTCEQLGQALLRHQAVALGLKDSEFTVTTTASSRSCNYCPGSTECCYPRAGGYAGGYLFRPAIYGYGGSSSGGYGGTTGGFSSGPYGYGWYEPYGTQSCSAASMLRPGPQDIPTCTVDVQRVTPPAATP